MLPFLVGECANPASPHREGARVQGAIDEARSKIADAVGVFPEELVFTSGATEANNIAVLGRAHSCAHRPKIISSPIEHKSVLAACSHLKESKGFEVVFAPVDRCGLVDVGALADLVDETTCLVAIQAANNEIGTIQPISEIAQITRRFNVPLHVDAVQSLGRMPIDLAEWDVDSASLSAHKCYGPKGIGALYIRGGARKDALEPLLHGGGQEWSMRPGTPNVPGIIGFGCAAELAAVHQATESQRLSALRDLLEDLLRDELESVIINGAEGRRLPGTTSLGFREIDADSLIANLADVAISSTSACNSGAPEPSHVLTALGISREDAYSCIRVGIGRFNDEEDIRYAASRIVETVRRQQSLRSGLAVAR